MLDNTLGRRSDLGIKRRRITGSASLEGISGASVAEIDYRLSSPM